MLPFSHERFSGANVRQFLVEESFHSIRFIVWARSVIDGMIEKLEEVLLREVGRHVVGTDLEGD